ncbi:MAG: hypothetical protein K6E39_03345 [Lachnospiraceae bacterium]|nr:hypothetical protein [Lachnospiraceae bacterium]
MKKRLLAIICFTSIILSTMWGIGVKAGIKEKKELPAKYDLRELGLVTPVKNQRPYGMCWAFAITAAMESNALVRGLGEYDLSEYQIGYIIGHSLAPEDSAIYGEGPTAIDSNQKWYDYANATGTYSSQLMKGYALMSEEKFPYSDLEKELGAEGISIDGALYVDSYYEALMSDRDKVKELIMSYGAVRIKVNASSWKNELYFNEDTNSMFLPAFTPMYQGIDHSVVIVGWDDDYSRDNFVKKPQGKGAWIIKNSWGTDWGDSGYGYLSYYDVLARDEMLACAVTVKKERNYDKIYQYDGGVGNGALYNVTAVAINFTTEDRETMTAVRIKPYEEQSADFAGTKATVKVYKGKFEGEIVQKAEPIYTQEYILKYTEYQTIGFTAPVDLKGQQEYYVIVTFDKSIKYCIDGEVISEYYRNIANGKAEETYLKLKVHNAKDKWYDMAQENKPNGASILWYESKTEIGVYDPAIVSSSACIKVLTKNREADRWEKARDFYDDHIGIQGACVIAAVIAMLVIIIIGRKQPRI